MGFGRLAIDYIELQTSTDGNAGTDTITVPGLEIGDHVIVTPTENAAGTITVDQISANTLVLACSGNESAGTNINILVIKQLNK